MGQILLKIVVSYVEAHPDQVVSLLHAGVDALIGHLKSQPAPAK